MFCQRMNRGEKRRAKRNSSGAVWSLAAVGALVLVALGVISTTKNRSGKSSDSPRVSDAANPFAGNSGSTNLSSATSTNEFGHREDEEGGSDAEKAVALLTTGNEFLADGRFEEAIRHYKHSLIHDPAAEDTHYNLGIALGRAGKTDEAIEHYQEALRILPDYADAHNNLGNLLVKQGKFDQAIEHLKQSIELNPESASNHNNLGTALARQGKITEATVHFAKAVQLMPNYLDAHYNLGNAYVSQGRIEEAIAEFNEALKIQPDFNPAMIALAKARQKAAELRK